MPIETSMTRLLMEIGFLAGGRGLIGAAETIFQGVHAVRPESGYPVIGMAMAHINMGDFSGASQLLLKEIASQKPDADLTKAFLGMALKLSGMNHESQLILNEVLQHNQDPVAVELARGLLENG